MDERKDKGLCFNYDEKFHEGHRCKAQLFSIVMMNEGNEHATHQVYI